MLTFPFLAKSAPAARPVPPAEAPADESHAAAKPAAQVEELRHPAFGAPVGCRRSGDDHP